MKKSKNLLAYDSSLFKSLVFYILLAILLLPYYQYEINPDEISYISIAQKYMRSDYPNAVNGYWGPLISWLLLPFLFFGIKPLLSAKLLSLVIGVMTIIQSNVLINILNINGLLRNSILYLIAVNVVFFAFIIFTPDLLFVCLALSYINTILGSSYVNSKYAGIISGIFGSGLYLTKSYGFPFFIVHFFVVNLILYLGNKNSHYRAGILSNFISGIVIFSLISGCWISIISHKYGQLMISTTGSYNYALMGPHPQSQIGFLDPPNNTAITASEDPSYKKIQSWSTFDSIGSLKHQIRNTLWNIDKILSILNTFSFLSIAVLSAATVYLLEKGRQIVTDNIFFLIVSISVLFSGYALVLVHGRYIWLSDILIIIIGAKLLELSFEKILLKETSKIVLIVIFVISFSLTPVKELYLARNTGKDVAILNDKINYLNINGRIASNNNWFMSTYLSFYNSWQYYGETGKLGELELQAVLENKMINYYIAWKPFEEKMKFLERCEEITGGKIDELRIYKLI